jgi:hypothetical protein
VGARRRGAPSGGRMRRGNQGRAAAHRRTPLESRVVHLQYGAKVQVNRPAVHVIEAQAA